MYPEAVPFGQISLVCYSLPILDDDQWSLVQVGFSFLHLLTGMDEADARERSTSQNNRHDDDGLHVVPMTGRASEEGGRHGHDDHRPDLKYSALMWWHQRALVNGFHAQPKEARGASMPEGCSLACSGAGSAAGCEVGSFIDDHDETHALD